MKTSKLDLTKLKFYVNTDTVDISNKQIGISYQNTIAREFCAGVNHKGTRESVHEATRIARLMAYSPEMLKFLTLLVENIDHIKDERLQTIADGALALIEKIKE